MVKVKHYDHVAVAVRSLKAAIPLFRDVLGGEYIMGKDSPGFRWIQLLMPGGAKIELLEPLGEDSFLHAFLDERGEGMHHITLKVENIRQAVDELVAKGYAVVGADYSDPNWMEAFIHPRSAHGVLFQLVQTPHSDEEAAKYCQLDIDTIMAGT